MNPTTDLQKKFIWLAFAEKRTYSNIEKELNISRKQLSQWTKEFENEWRPLTKIKSIHSNKKIQVNFREFYNWYIVKESDKKCEYCKITENQIQFLFDNDLIKTKRKRGRKLEFDRKEPDLPYND